MGARIDAADGDRPPLTIHGGDSARHRLRARRAERAGQERGPAGGPAGGGPDRVTEATPTRDHTERALAAFGATVDRARPTACRVEGGQRCTASRPACRATSRRRRFPRPRPRRCRAPSDDRGRRPQSDPHRPARRPPPVWRPRRGRADRRLAGRAGRAHRVRARRPRRPLELGRDGRARDHRRTAGARARWRPRAASCA